MIPKIIHYCWFGGKALPQSVQKCIESWKQFCPSYEFIEWNESNFDVNYNDFTREAYEAKNYAFVSDVARLFALCNLGGVYLDTDVEIIKPIDVFLQYKGVTCFQSEDNVISTGLLACEKGFALFEDFLSSYNELHFKQPNGKYCLNPNNNLLTKLCVSYGLKRNNSLQTVKGLTVFPREYFSPKNPITKEIRITKNTYAIHYYDGSWYSDITEYKTKLRSKYKFLPEKAIKFLAYTKLRGFRAAIRATQRYSAEKKSGKEVIKDK